MSNTISTKELRVILNKDIITTYSDCSKINLFDSETVFEASLDTDNEHFECALWLGENEETVKLTEKQIDLVFNVLSEANGERVGMYNDFSQDEREHALSLIN